jgi:hypothetical protein
MLEPPRRQSTAERDELLRRVDRRPEWMPREHGTSLDNGVMVHPMREGFFGCARCESARRRIDGDT